MTTNDTLWQRAQACMPGGVNSPVRAFRGVGGAPRFLARGSGARVWDVDGREYIDYVGSWGPLILGHAHPRVLEAIARAAQDGTSFGAPTRGEVELAELICWCVPSVEMVRLVNSGTEATMSAVRLARGFTGRDKIVKFEGCYHGHADSFLIAAGSGAATLGVPDSPGVTRAVAADTLIARYNDLESVERLVTKHHGQVAAVIVEPVAANIGVVPPEDGFLRGLRELTEREGIVLIFDEVITGFRLGLGGAQALYDIEPDLTTLGKIIGGGLPVGAYGGRADIMSKVSPLGPVYQAGTLSGNPIAVAAGIETLRILQEDPTIYARLEDLARQLEEGTIRNLDQSGVVGVTTRVGSLSSLFFMAGEPRNWPTVSDSDRRAYGRYFHAMLELGIYLAPSQFEAGFVSAAHTPDDIERTLAAQREALAAVAAGREGERA